MPAWPFILLAGVCPCCNSSLATACVRPPPLQALEYARTERYDIARRVFHKLCMSECPSFVKPWVSWAQVWWNKGRGMGGDPGQAGSRLLRAGRAGGQQP